MELDLLWLILAVVVETYVFLFGFLMKINEWYYVLPLGKKKTSLPPGDMGWPFIGNTLSFLRAFRSQDPDSFINNLFDRYGQTRIYKTSLFLKPSIIVCSPELCKKVLTNDEQFMIGYPSCLLKLIGKNALHGASDSEHKRLRRLITAPINGHDALSMYIGYIEDIVISSLQDWANMNSPIEFYNELKNMSFNVITKIFMGSADIMPESVTKLYSDLFGGFFAPEINVPGFAFHRALKASKMLQNLIKAHVDERRARKSDELNTNKGMIDLLLEAKDEEGEKLEDEHIVSLLLTFLLAGHESTALAGMWLIIYLHDHPETLQKAKEEQEEIIKRRPSSQKGLTLNEIRQMQYLSKAIDETLRRSSLVLSLLRKAKVDVEMNGYIIPKGWTVFVWNRAVHLNSEIYPNPKEFLPSRWDNHTPKPGSFLPFGAGSKRCPGGDLTKLELSILLHYFLLNYRFERINPNCPIRYLTIPCPTDNCVAKITKLP
ncbi:hypothetical protein PTKIN_Ptkin04bG0224100 [Pterospermum kingtungense]